MRFAGQAREIFGELAQSVGKVYLFTLYSCAADDTNEHCSDWADAGECKANTGMMLEGCCVSCGGGALPYFLYLGQLSQFGPTCYRSCCRARAALTARRWPAAAAPGRRRRTGAPPRAPPHLRVTSDGHFAVQLNHFMPGVPSYSVAVFLK